ncbi:MAG: hypothetical protein FJX75_09700, partial [Armatimonadetes bacterium]|nr:hypothetical protein [Armatimonadota bacterium]
MRRAVRLTWIAACVGVLCCVGGTATAQEGAELSSASFVVGDLLVFWQSGKGSTVTYRGLPVFAASTSEFVVHRAWEEVFYRTERGNETATVEEGPDQSVLTIRDGDEHFALQKRIIARKDGSFRVEYEYEVLDPEKAELQLLWGLGKPWIHDSQYRIVANGQERKGELKCPDQGRIDPWGGATEQSFTTAYGTLTITSERPLNLLCTPERGSLWYAQAMTRGEKHTEAMDVRIEPGPAAETGLKLAGLDWTKVVRDGRVAFTVKLARTAEGPKQVQVRAERAPAESGEPVLADLSETAAEVRCETRIERRGQFTFAVVVADPADGKELLRVGPLLVESSPYMSVMPRLSLYTSEAQAEIVADLAEDLDLNGLSLAVGDQAAQPVTDRRMIVRLDLGPLPDGLTEVTCRLLRGDQLLAQATTGIRKAPPKPNEVKIDNVSRSLIADGLPFVPFGFYTYYPLKEGVMDGEVGRGFTLFSPYHGGPHEGEKHQPILAYLDRCAQIGMKVNYHLMWPYHRDLTDEVMAQVRAEIEAVRDHPALLSWYIADEPGLEWVGNLTKVHNLVKELDPYHPTTIVFYQGAEHARQFTNAMDIVMVDPYPIPSRPVTDVSGAADSINAAFDRCKMLWMVPQAFGGNEWWQREPTAHEQRVMTYLALIHGARAVQYFIRSPRVSFPKSPVMWAECGALALETAEMTPALTSDEPAPKVTSSAPTVHACALRNRGVITILAANTEKKPQVVRLQLEGIDFTGEADVLFEDRKVSVAVGAIEEPIDAFGTRAYALPVGPLPQDDLAVDPQNLVVDPSWENMASAGTPSACYASIPGAANCFVDSRVARHGRHSLRMTGPTADELPSLTPFPISVKADQAYRVSIWAKGKTEGVVLKVSLGSVGKQEFPLTTEWQEYSFTGT